jgi:hypothetical protein
MGVFRCCNRKIKNNCSAHIGDLIIARSCVIPTLLPEALREAALAVVRHHHPLTLPFPKLRAGITHRHLPKVNESTCQCDYESG